MIFKECPDILLLALKASLPNDSTLGQRKNRTFKLWKSSICFSFFSLQLVVNRIVFLIVFFDFFFHIHALSHNYLRNYKLINVIIINKCKKKIILKFKMLATLMMFIKGLVRLCVGKLNLLIMQTKRLDPQVLIGLNCRMISAGPFLRKRQLEP